VKWQRLREMDLAEVVGRGRQETAKWLDRLP